MSVPVPEDKIGRGRLILPDNMELTIDEAQRLIGRADVETYTKNEISLISRSHFTVWLSNHRYMIKDGPTAVQDKPSKTGTFLNGSRLEGETELKNGDSISISDVDIRFEE